MFAVACREAPKGDVTSSTDARDQTVLAQIVDADKAFDAALKAADDAERAGDDAKAARLLATDATKAADVALDGATEAYLSSDWAKARRDSLVAVLPRDATRSLRTPRRSGATT